MSKPTCGNCGSESVGAISLNSRIFEDLVGEAPTYCGTCLGEEINRVRDTPVEIGESIPLFKGHKMKFSDEYLDEKVGKKMRELASEFSVYEVKWITDGVKELVLAEEKCIMQSGTDIDYAKYLDGKTERINSHSNNLERILVELKLKYGKFLDVSYNPLKKERFMHINYQCLRHEIETQLGLQ